MAKRGKLYNSGANLAISSFIRCYLSGRLLTSGQTHRGFGLQVAVRQGRTGAARRR